MSNEPLDKYFGISVSEWINRIPNELEVDAVSLAQIVGFGRDGYGLSGSCLNKFVYDAIMALLKKGAKPVRALNKDKWVIQDYYGGLNADIAKAVVDEWLSCEKNMENNYLWDIWFSIHF